VATVHPVVEEDDVNVMGCSEFNRPSLYLHSFLFFLTQRVGNRSEILRFLKSYIFLCFFIVVELVFSVPLFDIMAVICLLSGIVLVCPAVDTPPRVTTPSYTGLSGCSALREQDHVAASIASTNTSCWTCKIREFRKLSPSIRFNCSWFKHTESKLLMCDALVGKARLVYVPTNKLPFPKTWTSAS